MQFLPVDVVLLYDVFAPLTRLFFVGPGFTSAQTRRQQISQRWEVCRGCQKVPKAKRQFDPSFRQGQQGTVEGMLPKFGKLLSQAQAVHEVHGAMY